MMQLIQLNELIASDAPICYGILKPGNHVEGGVPVVKVKDFNNGKINIHNLLHTSHEIAHQYARSRLKAGDLLLSIRGTTGLVATVKTELNDANITQDSARIRVSDSRVREYLFFALQSPFVQSQIKLNTIGQAVKGINIASVRQLLIPWLPQKEKRDAITNIFRFQFILENKVQELIATKRSLKQGLMQQLLTGKRRFPEFENKQWKVVKVGEVTEINPPLKCGINKIEQVTFLSMSALEEGGGILRRQSRCYQEVSKGYTSFRENDVLVAKITPCFENGKSALATELANKIGFGSTEFHVLRCSKEIQPKFLYQIIRTQSFRYQGTSHMIGSAGQKRVPYKFIKNYKISLPSIPEQNRICQILETVDSEIMFLQQLQGLLKLQKRGLMQKLLTGEIQVPMSDENVA